MSKEDPAMNDRCPHEGNDRITASREYNRLMDDAHEDYERAVEAAQMARIRTMNHAAKQYDALIHDPAKCPNAEDVKP